MVGVLCYGIFQIKAGKMTQSYSISPNVMENERAAQNFLENYCKNGCLSVVKYLENCRKSRNFLFFRSHLNWKKDKLTIKLEMKTLTSY